MIDIILGLYLFISDADRYFERKRAQLIKKLKCMTRYGQEDFDEYSYTIEYECID